MNKLQLNQEQKIDVICVASQGRMTNVNLQNDFFNINWNVLLAVSPHETEISSLSSVQACPLFSDIFNGCHIFSHHLSVWANANVNLLNWKKAVVNWIWMKVKAEAGKEMKFLINVKSIKKIVSQGNQ